MRKVPLQASNSAIFDASGKAVARLGPQRYGERWLITYTSITTNSVSTTGMSCFRNFEGDTNFQEASVFNGNKDSSDTVFDLATGEVLIFVWTGGTPGRIGTVSVRGEITVL